MVEWIIGRDGCLSLANTLTGVVVGNEELTDGRFSLVDFKKKNGLLVERLDQSVDTKKVQERGAQLSCLVGLRRAPISGLLEPNRFLG